MDAATTVKYGMTFTGKELHIIAAWPNGPQTASSGYYYGRIKTACKRTYDAHWTYQDIGPFRVCPKCAATE